MNAHFSEIANFYKFSSPLDLFYAIAKSTFDVKEFSKLKFGNEKIIFPEEIKKEIIKEVPDVDLQKQIPNNHLNFSVFVQFTFFISRGTGSFASLPTHLEAIYIRRHMFGHMPRVHGRCYGYVKHCNKAMYPSISH